MRFHLDTDFLVYALSIPGAERQRLRELACPRCAVPIRRVVQSGRSTFYCPSCQR